MYSVFIPLTNQVSHSRPCRSWEKEVVPAKIYRPSVVLEVTLLVRNICLSFDISGRYLPAAIFHKLATFIYSHFEPSSHSDENHSPVLRNENFVVTKTLGISVFWYVKLCQWVCGYRHASKKLLPSSSWFRQEVFIFRTSGLTPPKTQCHISDGCIPWFHRCAGLKSRNWSPINWNNFKFYS